MYISIYRNDKSFCDHSAVNNRGNYVTIQLSIPYPATQGYRFMAIIPCHVE